MDIAALRNELGLSLQEFGHLIGLSSKGQVSQIERGEMGCSIDTALKIESISERRILAETLNEDVRRIREAGAAQATA